MLEYFNLDNIDIRLTNKYFLENGPHVDYKNKICIKPWGYEFLSYQNTKIGIWILYINKDNGTSIHTHFKKDTILVVLSGKIKLEFVDKIEFIGENKYCFIPKKKFHGLYAIEENTIIMEIEIYNKEITYTDKNDLLRLIDKYKRSSSGYENSVSVISEDIEKYNYFFIENSFNKTINNLKIIYDTFNNLSNSNNLSNEEYIILLDGEIYINGNILKEGSIIKKNDLNNIILDDQKFLQIIFDDTYFKNKIISSEEELEHIVHKLKDNNNKIILTCGCFDILHVGHMHILNQSKKLGDKLIVLLSSDEQIKFLKGNNRPINKLEDRLKLFTLVPYVDYIYVYYENLIANNESELDKLMNIVMPDIWTKGDDYTINDIYKKHPSLNKIEIIKRIDGKSTSNIIESCNT
jgi:rfaE bifunctional protein nucleotidyltransferase chain/domain